MTSKSTEIAVVGAGIAGLACARALADASRRVTVFEKSRGLGGRLATRRVDGLAFDHGAQYATARTAAFAAFLGTGIDGGTVARWSAGSGKRAGDHWHVGLPGMSGLAKPLASGLTVHLNCRITALSQAADGWRLTTQGGETTPAFEAVLITVPVTQAIELLGSNAAGFSGMHAVTMAPCWTVMAAFESRVGIMSDVLKSDDTVLPWAARNNAKPGRPDNLDQWVLQAAPGWSREHRERDAAEIAPLLLARFRDLTGAPAATPVHLSAHRWRYARVETALGEPCLWDSDLALGLAGDWCLGPRVEAAFISGESLAQAVLHSAAQ